MRRTSVKAAACAVFGASLALSGCKTTSPNAGGAVRDADTESAAVLPDVALPPLDWADGGSITVDIDNKSSFDRKIRLIDSAKTSIRIGYFIFGFDDSSSFLVKKLLEKAAQGVDVRIMIDGMTSQKNHDNFRMMMAQSAKLAANGTAKPIQVMYFRPIPDEVWTDMESWGFKDRSSLMAAMAGLDPSKLSGLILSNSAIKDNTAIKTLMALLAPGEAGARANLVNILKDAAINRTMPANATFDALANGVFQGAGTGMQFHPKAWINMLKRFHHKLIVVDDRAFMGGGRNVEDHYHVESDYGPLVAGNDLLSFMDADFITDTPKIAAAVATGFDAYWSCADNYVGCKPKIQMAREAPEAGKTYDAEFQALTERAARFAQENGAYQKDTEVVLHDAQFTATGVRLAYIENRMHPERKGFELRAFGEERSQYNLAWEALISNAKAGDDVVIHNAYVLLPPGMQIAIFRALKQGAKVRVFTNSEMSSNHGIVNVVANAMYAAMLNIAEKIRVQRGDAELGLSMYLYQTRETLHTKIGLMGNYMIVGSTNADPRSKLMDTQNGVIIAPGPDGKNPVADQYRAWLDGMLQRQRGGKAVLKQLTLEVARENIPPFEEVKAKPQDYDTNKQFDAYAAKLFEMAMDPESDLATQRLVGGFLNALFLML